MLDKSFNPTEAEARIYKMWEDSGAFKPRAAKPTDTKDDNYSIVIPPPNVTGSLHMGHALNNTCLLYTSPSPRDQRGSRMPSSA